MLELSLIVIIRETTVKLPSKSLIDSCLSNPKERTTLFMPAINVADVPILNEAVVSFSETYDGPKGRLLLEYWNDLRGLRARPSWNEFDFMGVMDIASSIIIKDVIDGGIEFRNRYWGTAITNVSGFDGTGKTIADCYKPEDVDNILTVFRAPLNNPIPMTLLGKNYYMRKLQWCSFAAVCVGFTGEDGTVSQLVTAYDD